MNESTITEQTLLLLVSEFSLFLAAYAEVNADKLGDLAGEIQKQATDAMTEAIPELTKMLIEKVQGGR